MYSDRKDTQKQVGNESVDKTSIRKSTYSQNSGTYSGTQRIESDNAETCADGAIAIEQIEDLEPWPAAVSIGTDNAVDEDLGIVPESINLQVKTSVNEISVTHLLLDCSGWAYIDDTALTLLVDVCNSFTYISLYIDFIINLCCLYKLS